MDWFNADLLRDCIAQVIDRLAALFATPKQKLKVVDTLACASQPDPASGLMFKRTRPIAKPGATGALVASTVLTSGKRERII
ncbi:hypothetical protein [Paraburkholderia tropica]|uniref:Uncharacterized protein n=1 Tax=Paraburkholderia tropica TaxID=92647 RepID=A0AAQ1GG58_9BURK|nr:hypothetical protein [Paraburkholderia tropica]RQN40812.1 hypothetical protein EHZ25_00695 [Paraburkholderia tropica]SEJ74284.1 hypothetical protein SAMN05216550_1082 [Paraburkholderia tropica]